MADWELNEPSGSTVMLDSSRNGIDGLIGRRGDHRGDDDGATGCRSLFASPTLPPAKAQARRPASDDRLNPGTSDYACTLRYRTTQPFGDIVQKGQEEAASSYFKIENPAGSSPASPGPSTMPKTPCARELNSGTPLNNGRGTQRTTSAWAADSC